MCLVIVIKLDSNGPVLFKQERIGIHKTHFNILKFRTMRIDTPKDMPTHRLKNPEQYITRVGSFLRKTSLDELPQIFNIIKGEMSIIGPRPALWNQYDLISERDKYGANDVLPGLTGWAQVVRLDCICFLKTIASVLKHDGVVEGGTGELKKVTK